MITDKEECLSATQMTLPKSGRQQYCWQWILYLWQSGAAGQFSM